MKKIILINLLSFLFSIQLSANDSYKVRTEVFELEVTKLVEIVPYKLLDTSGKSLNLTGKTSEIIAYLYPNEMESELAFDQMYKIEVESNKDLNEIKKDILFYFLKAADLKIEYNSHKQTNYMLSYLAKLDSCETNLSETNNSTSQINIQFKKRVWLRGLSLEESVQSLNGALDTNIFEAGESDLIALPNMYFVKRKLESDPVEYLNSKGFEVMEVEKVVETPVLVNAE